MKRFLTVGLRVLLVGAAVWAFRRETSGLSADSVSRQLQGFGWRHAGLALAAAAGSFLMLGLIEVIGLRYAGRTTSPISTRVALSTAFVANALSQSIGVSVLTGAAVRSRAYSRSGVSTTDVARTTAFVTVTSTLGLLACGAVALILAPAPVVTGHIAIATTPVGILLGAIVIAYLVWSAFGTRDHIGRGRWSLPRPSLRVAMAQLGLSVADWLLVGTVLFAFIPAQLELGLTAVLGAYVIAQLLAVTSHVPAGAGVFELATLGVLARGAPAPTRAFVVAALVMFRIVYYVVPLVLALPVAFANEWKRRTDTGRGAAVEVQHAG